MVLHGEVDWSLQASSVRPDFSTTVGLRQLGQPHQKYLDKFLDLFDPVVRGARLNVSTPEIGTTDKIRASGEISCLRICRRRTARRIRRFPDVAPARGSPRHVPPTAEPVDHVSHQTELSPTNQSMSGRPYVHSGPTPAP